MSKIKVFKLGFTEFATKNVEKLKGYYTEIMGLKIVEEDGEGRVYLSIGLDHHNIVLTPGNESGAKCYGYQLDGQISLKEVQQLLKLEGINSEIKSDAKPGVAEFLELTDPAGNVIHLYTNMEQSCIGFGKYGIVPLKLGHIAFEAKNFKKTLHFYKEVLGFYYTDMIGDEIANFLTCNYEHHVINIVQSNRTKMHHIAFQLKDASHQYASSDLLAKNGYPILWGPSRHTAGHNIATYHYDPDQNLVELYTDMDVFIPELGIFEPRPWHKDMPQKPKKWEGLSNWETEFLKNLTQL
jgi:catechol-2,3-dioxygenase